MAATYRARIEINLGILYLFIATQVFKVSEQTNIV